VLLRDGDLASFPTVAEVVEIGDDDISDQRVQREGRNERVEGRVCAGFVEGEKRGRKLVPCVRSVALGACDASSAGHDGRGLRGGKACGELLLHRPNAEQVILRIETKPAGRAAGTEQAVAALPGSQEIGADAGAAAQLPDPKAGLSAHGGIITGAGQKVDTSWHEQLASVRHLNRR
jgi:hypothetical protein